MNKKYFTDKANNIMGEIINDFPNLWEHYEPMVGNFGFTENDLFKNMNDILLWLERHNDYKLLYQNNEVADNKDEEWVWWLTDFE